MENLILPKNDNVFRQAQQPPKKPTQFYKLNLPETLQKENTPILKTYTTNHEQKPKPRNKANQNLCWPKPKLKTLKLILATRQNEFETMLMKENLLNKKDKPENLLAEKQTQTLTWKNATAKKLTLNF